MPIVSTSRRHRSACGSATASSTRARSSSAPAPPRACSACPTSSACSATACRRARRATGSSSARSRSRSSVAVTPRSKRRCSSPKFATKVTVVHRRDELRASKIMQDRAFANPKIDFLWNSVVEDVVGNGSVESLHHRDTVTGEESHTRASTACSSRSVTIPTTALFRGQLDLDDDGYIVTAPDSTRTSVEGVFAARRRAGPRVQAGDHRGGKRVHGRDRSRTLARASTAHAAS